MIGKYYYQPSRHTGTRGPAGLRIGWGHTAGSGRAAARIYTPHLCQALSVRSTLHGQVWPWPSQLNRTGDTGVPRRLFHWMSPRRLAKAKPQGAHPPATTPHPPLGDVTVWSRAQLSRPHAVTGPCRYLLMDPRHAQNLSKGPKIAECPFPNTHLSAPAPP